MNERRKFPRHELRTRVWCEGDSFTVWLNTLDASEEGILVRTSIPPEPGTLMRVTVGEGEEKVVADALVVWAKPGSGRGTMGLRLLAFLQGQELWQRLVSRRR